jgi:hypothetical protein
MKEVEQLEDISDYMKKYNPEFSLLYFHAKWNPFIPKYEKDYHKICNQLTEYIHFKIDSDLVPRAKLTYNCNHNTRQSRTHIHPTP